MPITTIRELIDAGVHFGHPASRWHPRMQQYILSKRNGVHVIDLRKTVAGMLEAHYFLRSTVRGGGVVLYVGTKRQARDAVRREAQRAGMPYVAERWLGGTLTNLPTIRQQIRRLDELERIEQSGEIGRYNKKELAAFRREKRKVVRNLEGIRSMSGLPQALLVIDPGAEDVAVKEANKLHIPVAALIDTDCDPSPVDVPIPGNDDAIRSIDLILSRLTDGIVRGLSERGGVKTPVDLSRGFSSEDLARVSQPEAAAADPEAAGSATPETT